MEVVYLGTPNSTHFAQMMQGILAGKAVICEKPFVSNMEEFHQVESLVLQRRAMVFKGITTRYMPNTALLKSHLKDIGHIHAAQLEFTQFSSRYLELKQGRRSNVFDRAFSGGCLYDIGVYSVHLAVQLFGAPQKVFAAAN